MGISEAIYTSCTPRSGKERKPSPESSLQNLCLSAQTEKGSLNYIILFGSSCFSAYQQNSIALSKLLLIQAIALTHKAFDSITRNCIAELLAGSKTYPVLQPTRCKDINNQISVGIGFSEAVNPLKIAFAAQNTPLRQFVHDKNSISATQYRGLFPLIIKIGHRGDLILCWKLISASCAATSQYLTATLSLHTLTETMSLFLPMIVRLISLLQNSAPPYMFTRITRSNPIWTSYIEFKLPKIIDYHWNSVKNFSLTIVDK